jgi:hypothetical protein
MEMDMNNRVDPRAAGAAFGGGRVEGAAFDAGLRAYMLSVYNYMLSGVLLSGMVALGMAMTGAVNALFNPATGTPSPVGWAAMLAPIGFVFLFGFRIQKMSEGAAQGLFFAFAALMGVSLSTIFLRYTGTSIATTFFATAVAFGACSLYGYTTKKDLSGFGTFLIMGVVGLIVASLLNLFLQSGPLAFAISAAGVLIFAGLTAYDTQKIKEMYAYVAGTEMAGKSAIMGALSLYLDFVNMFQFLLSFLGNRE